MSDAAGSEADEAAAIDPVPQEDAIGKISRRRMIGYLIAAPTVMAVASLRPENAAAAPFPTVQPVDSYDLSDFVATIEAPTKDMIAVQVNEDDTVSFALHRTEVGQGITTATAMLIADEMSVPIERVKVTLANSRPELLFNQITGGSTAMFTIYEPVRTAAAAARERLATAAAKRFGVTEGALTLRDGTFYGPDGRSATFGSLAREAAAVKTLAVRPRLKRQSQLKLVGTEVRRVDGHAIVTGTKQFAMDLDVPDALPTMLCRPPTINGSATGVDNLEAVKAMPGVTDVVVIPFTPKVPGGVAVRAATFGQCIDAVRALRVQWSPGAAAKSSDASVEADLRKSELPMPPALPGEVIEETYTFHFRPGDPLETNCAIADVREDSAEIWGALKLPIYVHQQIAANLGLPVEKVVVHVIEGGGSFGRHLFGDNAFEAAAVSKAMGKPVKLMWHRTDNFRQGRVHPMAISHVRIVRSGDQVLGIDQRHTGVEMDASHGLGETNSSQHSALPGQNALAYSGGFFLLTANVAYNFGPATQLLNEIYDYKTFNSSSVRNIYNPDVCTALELTVDKVAAAMGKDAYTFRREFVRDERLKAVLEKCAEVGQWGRSLPAGVAQGIAIHNEYKSRVACLVEIDTRPQVVNRKIRHAYTGPRVTKALTVVDVGLPINLLGLKAQMMGGMMDGIAQALTYSLHLKDGNYLEGSWDDAFYTRQWNTPQQYDCIVMPPTTEVPGGAGELGVPAAMAAVACAYARATGTVPTRFPINHDREDLGFEVFPTVPPIPPSPTDGLKGLRPKKKKRRVAKKRRPSTKAR